MNLGKFELNIISEGRFWLDGGTMFGVVPKVIWNRLTPSDEFNRIELAINCLLIRTTTHNILVDTGVGDKLDDKIIKIYKVERQNDILVALKNFDLHAEDITHVINTHLHFDHCGGNTIEKDGEIVPTFPKAKYIVQKQEWYDATHPNERTKASYMKKNFIPIEEAGQLMLIEGDQEIIPGINIIATEGHAPGHQSVLIESDDKKAFFLGDLIPTINHIKIPYITGFDLHPLKIIARKKEILARASKEKWLLIFEHDPNVASAYITEVDGKAKLQPVKI